MYDPFSSRFAPIFSQLARLLGPEKSLPVLGEALLSLLDDKDPQVLSACVSVIDKALPHMANLNKQEWDVSVGLCSCLVLYLFSAVFVVFWGLTQPLSHAQTHSLT